MAINIIYCFLDVEYLKTKIDSCNSTGQYKFIVCLYVDDSFYKLFFGISFANYRMLLGYKKFKTKLNETALTHFPKNFK